ncbi:hypothetical protein [Blastococcus sp. TF02A-35]|uniref:hypothetical protein n=1 Tax=Blastococcus sp. TF02A-35 TaxID=2559612 RepID=UPI0010734075|nr:hypothetical protein [Blastococcus sp. TF02A_35]TFV48949.1 hypothetical protein E4P43_12810 [Blastococcus sp. TF02A_35]
MTVLRPPSWLRGAVAAIGLVSAAAVAVGGIEEGGALLPLCLVGSVLVLVATWRNDRVRVELGREVVVVNVFRTLVLPWAEVERFVYDGGAWVLRPDGRRHAITAFSPPPGSLRSVEERCRQAVRTMEQVRRRR